MKQILIVISLITLLGFSQKNNDSEKITNKHVMDNNNVSDTFGTDFFEELKQAAASEENLINFRKKYILFNDKIAENQEFFENKENAEFIKNKNIEAVDFITKFIKKNGLELNDMFAFSLSKDNTFRSSFLYELEYRFYKKGKYFTFELSLIEDEDKRNLFAVSMIRYYTSTTEETKTIQENLKPLKLDEKIFENFIESFLEKVRQNKIEDLKKLIYTKNIRKYNRAFSDGSTPYYRVKACSTILDRIFKTPVSKDNEPILGNEKSFYLFIHAKEDELIEVSLLSFEFKYNKWNVDVSLMLIDGKVYIVRIDYMQI